jgi:hypothetical protein
VAYARERRAGLQTRSFVFVNRIAGFHFELQLADDADDVVGPDHAAEHLRHALLGQIAERLGELLGLDRIGRGGRGG